MDTLPLPPRPNLDQYRKRAKDLVKAARSNDDSAIRSWAEDWLRALARSLDVVITPFVQHSFDRAVASIEARVRERMAGASATQAPLALADAHFLIARAHGFENWSTFSDHADQRTARDQPFEAAADAVVTGDLPALDQLLQRAPELIRARSARVHRATLLHYVAANGVEDFRQKTPANAVAIARSLLGAGADVDALADTYGGGSDQTTMNLLVSSTHPAEAGLQAQLVETLIDFGATVDGLERDGSPIMTALAFGYRDAAEALARRGARVDDILSASALGRTDLVASAFIDPRTLAPGVPLRSPRWLRISNSPEAHIELALVWACRFGRVGVARWLLDRGVNPSARDTDRMTALHWAAVSGMADMVTMLVERGAPLEAKNRWGGTVLSSTLHFALESPSPGVDYPAMIRTLIAAGADVTVAPFPTAYHHLQEPGEHS